MRSITISRAVPATPADEAARNLLEAHWNGAMPDPQLKACYPALLAGDIEPFQQAGDLARICRPVDWFGLNHYSPIYVKADPGSQLGFRLTDPPPEKKRTGVGWAIDPQAFGETLLALHRRYHLPIYVMENGFGASESPNEAGQIIDQGRIDYLQSYTDAMRGAIRAGADVRGYFVWSLLDNFEWNSGYRLAIRPRVRGLRYAAAHPEGFVCLVCGFDQTRRIGGLTMASSSTILWTISSP